MTSCQLDVEPFKQCCCQCSLQGEIVTNIGSKHIGYVCTIIKELDKVNRYIQQDDQHSGGCEMFNDKRRNKRKQKET